MASRRKSPGKASGAARREVMSPSGQRDALARNAVALSAAVLTVAAVARLFAFEAPLQLGTIAGAAAGLLATSPLWAALAAAAAVTAGLSVALGALGAEVALPAAIAMAVAPAVSWIVRRKPSAADWIAYAAVGLIVVNMWATTLYVSLPGGGRETPLVEQVGGTPKLGVAWNDADFYRRVLWHMRDGKGYYQSYRNAYHENAKWRMDPPSVLSYRLPTAFWFWASLPGGPIAVIVAWLLVSTAALVAGVRLGAGRVPAAFTLPASAGLATYLIYFGTSTMVLFTEGWAAALGILAVAATVRSFRSQAWRSWTAAAVALAALACLVRELMVFLPVAGVVAALLGGGPQRRFRASAWGAGIGVFGAAYAAHAAAIGGVVSGQRAAQAWSSGGLRFFADAFSWATDIIGGGAFVLAVFAVMAAIGIRSVPGPGERWFLAVAAALPLAVFLVFGNDASFEGGASTNYWGTVVVPLLIALSPWAFRAVPGLVPTDGAAEAGRTRAPAGRMAS